MAHDLRIGFPEMKGLSPRNLKYMRKFADDYPASVIVQQLAAQTALPTKKDNDVVPYDLFVQHPAAQIPWGHVMLLLDKTDNADEMLFYAQKAIEEGWSRNVLTNQVETELYNRKGALANNFDQTLPAPQSELAKETFKDPYLFDFLNLTDEATEREVEDALLTQITDLLLELGAGFAFLGRQYHLEVGGQDYYLDLLFYHVKLRCYVVVELKIGEFKPEYAGKVNFYLTALNEQVKSKDDEPSIGIILCKEKNRIVTEYSLKEIGKPMGVAEYQLAKRLPKELREQLPTKDDFKQALKGKKK